MGGTPLPPFTDKIRKVVFEGLPNSPTSFTTGVCFSLNSDKVENLFSKSSLGHLLSQLEGNKTNNKVSLPSGKSRGLKLNLDMGQASDIFDHFDVTIGSAGSYLAKDQSLGLELGREYWLDLTAQAAFSGIQSSSSAF